MYSRKPIKLPLLIIQQLSHQHFYGTLLGRREGVYKKSTPCTLDMWKCWKLWMTPNTATFGKYGWSHYPVVSFLTVYDLHCVHWPLRPFTTFCCNSVDWRPPASENCFLAKYWVIWICLSVRCSPCSIWTLSAVVKVWLSWTTHTSNG